MQMRLTCEPQSAGVVLLDEPQRLIQTEIEYVWKHVIR